MKKMSNEKLNLMLSGAILAFAVFVYGADHLEKNSISNSSLVEQVKYLVIQMQEMKDVQKSQGLDIKELNKSVGVMNKNYSLYHIGTGVFA